MYHLVKLETPPRKHIKSSISEHLRRIHPQQNGLSKVDCWIRMTRIFDKFGKGFQATRIRTRSNY